MEKVKSFKQYVPLAVRTLNDLGSETKNSFHMKSGMATELGEILDPIKKHVAYGKELDVINIKEEVGDLLWYFACNLHLTTENEEVLEKICEPIDKIFLNSFKKENKIEKFKDNQKESLTILTNISNGISIEVVPYYMSAICKMFDIDIFEAMTLNIEKLKKRFPNKFEKEKAVKRDTETERKVLENKKEDTKEEKALQEKKK